jgi:AraC-like DNA-binding protein
MTSTFTARHREVSRGFMALTESTVQDTTIRVGPMVNLPELLRSVGHDPLLLFQDCGFQLERFSNPENRLPFIQTSKLIEHCALQTGVDHLGFSLGQMATPSHLGLAGFMLQSAPTAGEALKALVDNLDLHDQGGIVALAVDSRHSSLSYSLLLAGTCAVEQIYDLSAVMMYKIMRAICGQDWQADSVNLARRQPADTSRYQKLFDAPIYFNTPECSVTFQSRWLDTIPAGYDPLLYRHLEEEAQMLHENSKRELVDQLPAYLHKGLLCGQFSSHQIAASLGIHERTLHRRLKAVSTSFRKELDRARQTLSEELLAGTSLPICDIAATLGYSDSSGFIRAFQRWTHNSPSAWRRQHREAQSDESTNHAG